MLLEEIGISFPGVGIDEINPPTGFYIPGTNFEIKFYGLIIAIGMLLAVVYAMRRSKQFGLTSDDIMNIVIVGLPSAILGARLYYVIFYGTPWNEFFKIRNGGLAIYGGVIGAVLALGIYFLSSPKRRQKLLPSLDIAGLGLLIGQSIGRWGNFFNREAHGGVTDCFLRMGLRVGGEWTYYHPTFLYESVWNAVGLLLLHFLSKKRKFDGEVFLLYLAWYGLGRAVIEGMRTDSLYWGPFRVSQVLAALTCVISLGIIAFVRWRKHPDGSQMLVNRSAPQEPAENTETTEHPEN